MIIELNNLGGSDMEHIFLDKTDEHASKEQLIQMLKETIAHNGIEIDDNIDDMIKYADNAYKGIKRYSGDEYVTHTLNVAIILAQLETDINTIEAGLFCDVTKKSAHALSELLCELPVQVQLIIKEVSDADIYEIDKLSDSALLVKIAERLHNMRTIEFMDESKRSVKAKETVDIFMPIARRLGTNKIISELNDLSVKYIH
jgi:GTP pyrophosphokinase